MADQGVTPKAAKPDVPVPEAAATIDQQALAPPAPETISPKDLPIPADQNPARPTGNQVVPLPPPMPEDFPTPSDPAMAALTRPTDFPNEPVTAGHFGGPGVDFIRSRYETDDDFFNRVATELESSPEVNQFGEFKNYLDRLRRGL